MRFSLVLPAIAVADSATGRIADAAGERGDAKPDGELEGNVYRFLQDMSMSVAAIEGLDGEGHGYESKSAKSHYDDYDYDYYGSKSAKSYNGTKSAKSGYDDYDYYYGKSAKGYNYTKSAKSGYDDYDYDYYAKSAKSYNYTKSAKSYYDDYDYDYYTKSAKSYNGTKSAKGYYDDYDYKYYAKSATIDPKSAKSYYDDYDYEYYAKSAKSYNYTKSAKGYYDDYDYDYYTKSAKSYYGSKSAKSYYDDYDYDYYTKSAKSYAKSGKSSTKISTASLKGNYVIVETTGDRVGASLGIVQYDGVGGLKGTLIVNYPDPDSTPDVAARAFFTTALNGTYELGDNGIGTQTWTYEDPPAEFGDELTFDVQLLVTKVKDSAALKVQGNYQQPSPFVPARLVFYTSIKRPENKRGGFFVDSLKGAYSLTLEVVGNQGIGFGIVNFDGKGGLSGFFNGNEDVNETERGLFSTPIIGTYSVQPDGFGFVQWTFTAPGFDFDIDFLIIEGTQEGQATALAMQFQQPSPLVLGLVTIKMTLIGP